MGIWENIKKRGLVDFLNPMKWKVFARYIKMSVLKQEYEELNIPEYKEQIVYRMNKCKTCVKRGECLHCGCKSPEVFYDKINECSGLNWFRMDDPEEWKKHKKQSGINIDPDHMAQLEKYGEIKEF